LKNDDWMKGAWETVACPTCRVLAGAHCIQRDSTFLEAFQFSRDREQFGPLYTEHVARIEAHVEATRESFTEAMQSMGEPQ